VIAPISRVTNDRPTLAVHERYELTEDARRPGGFELSASFGTACVVE